MRIQLYLSHFKFTTIEVYPTMMTSTSEDTGNAKRIHNRFPLHLKYIWKKKKCSKWLGPTL